MTRHPTWIALCAAAGAALAPRDVRASDANHAPASPLYKAAFYYGTGIGGNLILNADRLCTGTACALGNGYGVTLRGGVRFAPILGVELSYDAYWHSSGSLFALAVLQDVRLDARVSIPTQSNVEPSIVGGAGLYLYGNQFRADTYGIGFQIGFAVDFALSELVSVGGIVAYRGIRLAEFTAEGMPYGTSLVSAVWIAALLTLHPDFQPLGHRLP